MKTSKFPRTSVLFALACAALAACGAQRTGAQAGCSIDLAAQTTDAQLERIVAALRRSSDPCGLDGAGSQMRSGEMRAAEVRAAEMRAAVLAAPARPESNLLRAPSSGVELVSVDRTDSYLRLSFQFDSVPPVTGLPARAAE